MKIKNKKICIFTGLMFLFIFSTINTNAVKGEFIDIKTSGTWDNLIPINFSIYIDGNWSKTADLYDWCSGSGSEEDPWIIEGIHVTNENQSAYISIETAEQFIIRNVTVSNYSKPYGSSKFAGIYVEKGEYGVIENCTLMYCSDGISLREAKDSILITNNTFIGSHNDSVTGMGKAIRILEAKGVTISYNDIYNYYDGIYVRAAEEIHIENNRIETSFGYISDTGIYFCSVDDSSIINNDFYGCKFDGHEYDVTLAGNSGLQTSFIEKCHNLTIRGNRYYDLSGNLIGESTPLVVIDFITVIAITIFSVVVIAVVCVIFMIRRNRRIK